jgi:hypothetical protein
MQLQQQLVVERMLRMMMLMVASERRRNGIGRRPNGERAGRVNDSAWHGGLQWWQWQWQ